MTRRNAFLVVAGAVVGVVALWWFFVYAPRGRELDDVRDDRQAATATQQSLRATLNRLEEIDRQGPQVDAELARLGDAVPETPDLAGFIVGANRIAVESGIDWLSVAPAEPSAEGPGPATIRLAIQVEGGFFQVLDYLNRLEDLERLVVVDGVTVSAEGAEDGGGGGGTFGQSGAPNLSAALTARMFTQATTIGGPAEATDASTTSTTSTTGTTGSTGLTTSTAGGAGATTTTEVVP